MRTVGNVYPLDGNEFRFKQSLHILSDSLLVLAFLYVIALYIPSGYAAEVSLPVIAQIESSNNPHAIGDHGRALGLYQLHKDVIREFNKARGASYSHRDALDPVKARWLANWYLNRRIPALLKHYRLPDTTKNRLIAYNAGIARLAGHRPIPSTTKQYIAKYNKLTKERRYAKESR